MYVFDSVLLSEIVINEIEFLLFYFFFSVLRMGRSLEVLYLACKTIHYEDLIIRLTSTMSKISSALFLLTDHMLWIGRSGLVAVNTNKWAQISNKYWLYSILINLLRDFYEITRIIEEENIQLKIKKASRSNLTKQLLAVAAVFVNDHKDVFWDCVKNGCDVWIPMTALGYTHLKPGTIGLLGTISSIAGLISMINPNAKLLPS